MDDFVVKLLERELGDKIKDIKSLIEIPPSSELGDFSFPCFSLAKIEKKSPLLIAEELAEKIRKDLTKKSQISNVNAKAGYVNFFVNKSILSEDILGKILKEKEKYGKCSGKTKFLIEFSQPNTHKAFHVGHIRGTSLGESLARILEFSGNKVIRVNYSGDTGMHIAKWIWCYNKFHKSEKLNDNESWIASIYVDAVKRLAKDEDLQKEVDEINRKIESKEDKSINSLWSKTRELSIKSWKKIYDELDTYFDIHYFESQVESEGKKISLDLLDRGIAKKSEDAVIIDLKEYNLSVWVLLRKDGTVLYSAKDLALAIKKVNEFHADKYLVTVGDEQNLHFQQLVKTLNLMDFEKKDSYDFLTYGMVRLPTGKMSSRTGDNILYSEFMLEMKDYAKEQIKKRYSNISKKELEERALKICISAIKYSMLKQDPKRVIVFSKEEAINFDGNTGPYLLYSYARANSIIKKIKKKSKVINIIDLKQQEIDLIKKLGDFPKIVKKSCNDLAPNLIANYIYDLSQLFNTFYHECPVLGSVEEGFRLKLVEAFKIVIKSGLNLLGIKEIEEM